MKGIEAMKKSFPAKAYPEKPEKPEKPKEETGESQKTESAGEKPKIGPLLIAEDGKIDLTSLGADVIDTLKKFAGSDLIDNIKHLPPHELLAHLKALRKASGEVEESLKDDAESKQEDKTAKEVKAVVKEALPEAKPPQGSPVNPTTKSVEKEAPPEAKPPQGSPVTPATKPVEKESPPEAKTPQGSPAIPTTKSVEKEVPAESSGSITETKLSTQTERVIELIKNVAMGRTAEFVEKEPPPEAKPSQGSPVTPVTKSMEEEAAVPESSKSIPEAKASTHTELVTEMIKNLAMTRRAPPVEQKEPVESAESKEAREAKLASEIVEAYKTMDFSGGGPGFGEGGQFSSPRKQMRSKCIDLFSV